MSFIAAAAIAGGGALVGGAIGAIGAERGAKQQADAANNATAAQLQMFNTVNQQQAPWRQAGENALSSISDMSGFFNKQFGPDDLATSLAPNYEFTKQQGLGAIQNFATSTGGLIGGNTLKGIADYTTNYAQNSYQQAFQNFTANQSNIFNRLASIAGLGQTANATTAQAAGTLGTGAASTMAQAGAALGGGTVGAANAISGATNNAMSWYTLPRILAMGNNAGAGPG
jgi:hypothetical protein